MESALDTGNTAWMLTASALVLLMIPGLAFFYGGMVRSKSVLNMLMMIMGALFIVGILWVIYGYSMAFGNSYGQAGLLGNVTQYIGLEGNVGIIGRRSPNSLYNLAMVTFEEDEVYNQRDAEGFIKLKALRLRLGGGQTN